MNTETPCHTCKEPLVMCICDDSNINDPDEHLWNCPDCGSDTLQTDGIVHCTACNYMNSVDGYIEESD